MLSKKTLALAGLLTIAAATPSMAQQRWTPLDPAIAGVQAGAAIGGAALSGAAATARAFVPGGGAYAYAPGYDAYAYAPGYNATAYEPGTYPARNFQINQFGTYDSGFKSCATDGQYNRTDYSAC